MIGWQILCVNLYGHCAQINILVCLWRCVFEWWRLIHHLVLQFSRLRIWTWSHVANIGCRYQELISIVLRTNPWLRTPYVCMSLMCAWHPNSVINYSGEPKVIQMGTPYVSMPSSLSYDNIAKGWESIAEHEALVVKLLFFCLIL